MAKNKNTEHNEGGYDVYTPPPPKPAKPGPSYGSMMRAYSFSIVCLLLWLLPLTVMTVKSFATSGMNVLLWGGLALLLFISYLFVATKAVKDANSSLTVLINIGFIAAAAVLIWQMNQISHVDLLDLLTQTKDYLTSPGVVAGH